MIEKNVDINAYLPYRFRHREGNTYSVQDAISYANAYPATHALEDFKVLFLPERLQSGILIVLDKYSGLDANTGTLRPVPPMNPVHARILRSYFGPIGKEMTSKEVAWAILKDRALDVIVSMGGKLPKRREPEPAKEEVKPAAEPVKRRSLAERRAERRAAVGTEAPAVPAGDDEGVENTPTPTPITPQNPAPATGGLTVEMLETARRELMGEPARPLPIINTAPPRRPIDPIAEGIARGITDDVIRGQTLRELANPQDANPATHLDDERPRH